jgi:hypothetical protein
MGAGYRVGSACGCARAVGCPPFRDDLLATREGRPWSPGGGRATSSSCPSPQGVRLGTAVHAGQGIPQVTNAELIAYLEAILLELRDRLNNYLDLGANDLIAADEGFNFTGQLQATLSDASEHATHVREQLIEIQRKGSE